MSNNCISKGFYSVVIKKNDISISYFFIVSLLKGGDYPGGANKLV